MKLNDIYRRPMPYPIYGRMKDFLDAHKSLITESVKFETEDELHHISFSLKDFGTPELKSLVKKGKAKCVCEVDCKASLYRNSFYSQDEGNSLTFDFHISRRSLMGRVELLIYLVSITDLDNYEQYVKDLNPIYSGQSISIEKGYCLALLGQGHHDFDIEYDKLQNAGAFMKVRKGIKPIPYCALSQTMIYINLPDTMYNNFKEYDNTNKTTAGAIYLSSFVLNFLVQALMEMQQNEWYNNDSPNIPLWARAICYKMTHSPEFDINIFNGMQIADAIDLAQRLLGNPYDTMVSILKNNE